MFDWMLVFVELVKYVARIENLNYEVDSRFWYFCKLLAWECHDWCVRVSLHHHEALNRLQCRHHSHFKHLGKQFACLESQVWIGIWCERNKMCKFGLQVLIHIDIVIYFIIQIFLLLMHFQKLGECLQNHALRFSLNHLRFKAVAHNFKNLIILLLLHNFLRILQPNIREPLKHNIQDHCINILIFNNLFECCCQLSFDVQAQSLFNLWQMITHGDNMWAD